MIAIALTFPAGRLHATPWGRHVNEGTPEWPPSPWRLLRGLVATWKRKLDDRLKIEEVRPILQALAAPPQFALPPATAAHTRHYMPLRYPDQGDRTKVFDTFVVLSRRDAVTAVWPDGLLSEVQRQTLDLLLANIGSLGRAESWCDGVLLSDTEARRHTPNCVPLEARTEGVGPGQEVVRVLCAKPDEAFTNEHTPKIRTKVAPAPGAGKRRVESQAPLYDPDWHLCLETAELHDKRWSDPPGSQWVRYVRESTCFAGSVPRDRTAAPVRPWPQVARFALDSTVLPLLQDTLPIAEQVRGVLMGIFGRLLGDKNGERAKSSVFSGKAADGTPLTGHRHAYFLPTDEDGDGRLDHVTVYAEQGFDPDHQKAINRLSSLKREVGAAPLRLVLLGTGLSGEFGRGPLRPSRTWVSTTPFLVTRHPKRRGTKRDEDGLLSIPHRFVEKVLREEVARLCDLTGMPSPERIECLFDPLQAGVFRVDPTLWADGAGARLRPIQFKRFRQKRSDDGGRRPTGAFRIIFPNAVAGPICLGHSSHFGLGLFLPQR